jgi:hypothetical protein
MKFLLSQSIWAHDAIPADEWKYRNLKRVMFPVIDFFFLLAGLAAARFGVPAISLFFDEVVVDFFSYILCFSALFALIGVAFPRLWPMEILGKSVLLSLITTYFVALFILTSVGEGNRGFVLMIAAVALCPLVWRLSLLGAEWQKRNVDKKTGEIPIVENLGVIDGQL